MSSQGRQEQQQQLVPPATCKRHRTGAVPEHALAGEQLRLGRAAALTALAQARSELLCNGWVGTGCIPASHVQLQGSRVGEGQGFQSPLACPQPPSPQQRPADHQDQAIPQAEPKQPALALPLTSGRSLLRLSSTPFALPLSPRAMQALQQHSAAAGTRQPPHCSPAQAGLCFRPGTRTNSRSPLSFSLAKCPSEGLGHAQGAPAFAALTFPQTGMGICSGTKVCRPISKCQRWERNP